MDGDFPSTALEMDMDGDTIETPKHFKDSESEDIGLAGGMSV